MEEIKKVSEIIQKGKKKLIKEAVQEALDAGIDPIKILNDGMIGAMNEIGELFSTGEIYVPEMLIAAKTMKEGVGVLKPYLESESSGIEGKIIIGTVHGDLHDIGKNLVAMMLESSGFEVIDLGIDVPVEKVIQSIKDNPDTKIVALSALLTTTMGALKETVEAIKGNDRNVKTLVGGAPVSAKFAEEIGADGYAPDAGSAVNIAKELINN